MPNVVYRSNSSFEIVSFIYIVFFNINLLNTFYQKLILFSYTVMDTLLLVGPLPFTN